jgi:hypothetical protein
MPMEPFENAANFNEDVGMFQAAAHSPHVDLPAVTLSAIHLAVDGSNQDATARGLAQVLAARSGAKLAEQFGRRPVCRGKPDRRPRAVRPGLCPAPR